MNKIAKECFKSRLIFLSIILALALVITGIYTGIYNKKNIIKTDFTVSLNEETAGIFEEQFNNKKDFYKYYNYNIASESQNADFVLTSDISMINTSSDYSIEGYSPLIICLKDNENLNNYLKTTTKEGFLTCNSSKKITTYSSDDVTCHFSRIIDAVINGEDWSDLGGEDRKITIYCPDSNTIEGSLFYDFLLITINNGKYPENNLEEIKSKADAFLNSQNVIQTDVGAQISKLNGELQEDIYVLFESDLIYATNGRGDICVTYPETTVIKQIYLQYNNTKLKETFSEIFEKSTLNANSLAGTLRYAYYYRSSSYPALLTTEGYTDYYNVQKGFNYYELTN